MVEARMKRPYLLWKRGRVWYYKVPEGKHYLSTGQSTRRAAEQFVIEVIHQERGSVPQYCSFRRYAEPFFLWDRCPHIRRVLEETGRFTERHARIQRGRLKNHVFGDPFAAKRLSEITRADIFDLRSRLLKRCSPATANKVIDVVKVVLREAVIREELRRDPTELVRRVRHQKRERGVFTVEELRRLFPERGYGPWKDACDYTCFFLAAVSGARRGELLVLRWRHLDFEGQYLKITEAWKGRDEIGGTKSGRARIVPLSSRIFEKFDTLRLESLHVQPDDFLFCYDDGSRVGETWWHERFKRALRRAEIEPAGRWLTPHSFRHTVNTIVRDAGQDPAKIRAVLGWMDEAIQDNYTHWEAQHLRQWAEIVDEIWG
jgi:integrase